jgi:hypothetical protein
LPIVSCKYSDESEEDSQRSRSDSPPEVIKEKEPAFIKTTLSQAMMNSNLYQSLPKYIFQSEHAPLERVKDILNEVKEQQNRESDIINTTTNGDYEVSEYPIEMYEHQQHAIERHMSIK